MTTVYYQLESPVERRTRELFAFFCEDGRSDQEARSRLWDSLAAQDGTDEFLDHTTPVADGDISPKLITGADFLRSVDGLPIFSARFVEVLGDELADALRFHPCVVRCRGQELEGFVVAKTLTYLPLVDHERSQYLTVTGRPILSRPAFHHDLADTFHIARDLDHPHLLVCSRRMVDLVAGTQLRVFFEPRREPQG